MIYSELDIAVVFCTFWFEYSDDLSVCCVEWVIVITLFIQSIITTSNLSRTFALWPFIDPLTLDPAGPFFPPFTPCPFELPPPVVPFWPLTDPCWPLPVELTPPAWPLAFDPMPPAWPLTLDPVLPAELFALLYEEANAVLLVGLGLRLRPARNQRDNVKNRKNLSIDKYVMCYKQNTYTHKTDMLNDMLCTK